MGAIAAGSLAGSFGPAAAIGAGLAGGVAFLVVVYAGRASGMTRMDFLHILGSMLVPKASRTVAYTVGFVVHWMMSAVFGLVHAGILGAIGASSVGSAAAWDALIGSVHGVGVLVLLPPILAAAHPLIRNGHLESPGVALTGYAALTPVGSLMAHVVFGLVTGTLYAAAVL